MHQKPPTFQKQQQQSISSQPKTIEDYRNNIKLLKLKLMKVMKEKEELQKLISNTVQQNTILNSTENDDADPEMTDLNNYLQWKNRSRSRSPFTSVDQQQQQQQQSRDASPSMHAASPQHYDEMVVKMLQKGASTRLGLTPESLFRAADVQCCGEVPNTQMKMFLKKAKLGLKDGQIQRFIALCDEDCAGVVRRENYYNVLAAYDCAEETMMLIPQQHTDRTFTQKSLVKLARIFAAAYQGNGGSQSKKSQVFQGANLIQIEQLQELARQNAKVEKMSGSEVTAAFNFFDPERTGQISVQQLQNEMLKMQQSPLFTRTGSFGHEEPPQHYWEAKIKGEGEQGKYVNNSGRFGA